jgi:LmbE family N-acetylglucosaminyl deacetylase
MKLDVGNKTILAVAAHADDLDFGCAGSIAAWVKEGANIHYLILTDGSKGSDDMSLSSEELSKLRQEEQSKAAKILGVRKVHFANFVDGELINSEEVRYWIVRLIRQLKPDIVLTMDPTFVYTEEFGFVNHPDHRNAGQATLDAVYPYARNARTFPDLLKEGLKPHVVREILLINFLKSNFTVDITTTFDQKIRALKEHKSQIINFDKFEEMMKKRAKMTAGKSGMKYAENFVRISLGR